MILFDSSVWIAYANGISNPQTQQLKYLLSKQKDVFVNATIVQEVLQGLRDDKQYSIWYGVMSLSTVVLTLPHFEAAINAAQLYRQLRKKGVTIRKPNDCLIAAYAIHYDVELCHNDRDFDLIAAHTALKIWNP
jgi:predicted nucleic acid-binding protein